MRNRLGQRAHEPTPRSPVPRASADVLRSTVSLAIAAEQAAPAATTTRLRGEKRQRAGSTSVGTLAAAEALSPAASITCAGYCRSRGPNADPFDSGSDGDGAGTGVDDRSRASDHPAHSQVHYMECSVPGLPRSRYVLFLSRTRLSVEPVARLLPRAHDVVVVRVSQPGSRNALVGSMSVGGPG